MDSTKGDGAEMTAERGKGKMRVASGEVSLRAKRRREMREMKEAMVITGTMYFRCC